MLQMAEARKGITCRPYNCPREMVVMRRNHENKLINENQADMAGSVQNERNCFFFAFLFFVCFLFVLNYNHRVIYLDIEFEKSE